MRVSLNWIKRILNLADLDPARLREVLTLTIAEIEPELEIAGPRLDGVVVGKVLTCAPHPGSDHLRVTTVEVGAAAPLPIVCGAPNVAAGQTVAVALEGATVTVKGRDGAPQALTIKEVKLRGELSRGMICAEDEIGLGTKHEGILVLDDRLKPGRPLREALGLGDAVLVVENHAITHRPDLWGQVGWAREIAAALGLPPPAPLDLAWTPLGNTWSADIQDDGCLTYAGAVVEGVDNRPSPLWMQELLTAVGVRPLGLLVDVTNFVMMELGEPMHAFDRRDVAGERIVARAAAPGEIFRTLDGKSHTLTAGDLLIADGKRALALAGIMGGENSMVKDDTTTVLLEAATFRGERIRRTRLRAGLVTDSATRFEKGLFPEYCPAALNRAIALLAEGCPGCRVTQRFIAGQTASSAKSIAFSPDAVRRLTGIDVAPDRQAELLARLGFAAQGGAVAVPWWRARNTSGPADLVEEIARLDGYHRIQPETPRLPAAAPPVNELRAAEHRVRRVLSALGWDEVATYAFTSEDWAKALGWGADAVRLAHPLSSEQTVLRLSLMPNLAEALGRNRKSFSAVSIYEVGRRYGAGIGGSATPDEEIVLAGVCAAADEASPFFAARDAALAALRGLGYPARFTVRKEPHPELLPGRAADLWAGEERVGVCGELPAAIRRRADCPERVGFFSLDLERLVARLGAAKPVSHRMPNRFPVVEREFTWVCPEALSYGELESVTRQAAGALGVGVELVTIFCGGTVAAGHKAVSLLVRLQAEERTLDEKDLQQVCGKIVKSVEARTPARLRA